MRKPRTRREAPALSEPQPDPVPEPPSQSTPPITSHPVVRGGIYAWGAIGLAIAVILVGVIVAQLRLVVVPLIVALFPAALLAPLMTSLRRRLPDALAALIVLLGGLALLVGVGTFLVTQVIDEAPELAESTRGGITELEELLETGPFGLDPTAVREWVTDVQENIAEGDWIRVGLLGAAGAVAELVAMLLLMLVVLFFYLKDGQRIAWWLRSLFPTSVRGDVQAMASRGWETIGAYFRGQLLVAFADGVFIGVGLAILGVPLALPLGVLVFFGGLFPIVGAVLTGIVAVLVALADGGLPLALGALAVVLAVQQLESNILAPLVLGKATQLHPLAVITALTAGGILLGVLGAFIAVPIAASVTRAVGYLRHRHTAQPTAAEPAELPA